MTLLTKLRHPTDGPVLDAALDACRAVPPAWPLDATVAVNPYLGQSHETLAMAGARLARTVGAPIAMPRAWYAAKIDAGEISDADLAGGLERLRRSEAAAAGVAPLDIAALKAAARRQPAPASAPPTVADLAASVSGVDWPGVIAERFGAFASGHFDEGQALWSAPRDKGAWRAWRAYAAHDLTPEILGLRGFGAAVDAAPDTAEVAVAAAGDRLALTPAAAPTYLHQLLMSLGGWAQLARQRLWAAEMRGEADDTLMGCLAVRLFWETALLALYGDQIADMWAEARAAHAAPLTPTTDLLIDAALQAAAEFGAQRRLAATLDGAAPAKGAKQPARPALQAAFCIDVRSEVFRRALEAVDPGVETLGFAGFFGLGVAHQGVGSDVSEARLPVLLSPGLTSTAGACAAKDDAARITARAGRAWGRFKLAAVSSFAFVESAGPLYVGKLLRDSLGLQNPTPAPEPAPKLDPAVGIDARVEAAEAILRAMSLTTNFARLVLLAGHGAAVVNNPHKSALQCGACGGYSGEVNARLLAGLLNDPGVRAGLAPRGIEIPSDTLFVGALHDTTTDAVTLFDGDGDASGHAADLAQTRGWLAAAGRVCRGERAARLPGARGDRAVKSRSRDWSEVRPEWALAGCKAFIAAPRSRTAGRRLYGRAFLHSYDWRADAEFKVLELIMTAPVVVASWISLQYYGSSVAPDHFGAGDKLLHNVVGGVGVVEGNGGALRVGLPWQSVHDGETLMHEPLRLSVCVEAPREAMIDILRRHDGVRALFDNHWLHLFALDDAGRLAWRYQPWLAWTALDAGADAETPLRAAS